MMTRVSGLCVYTFNKLISIIKNSLNLLSIAHIRVIYPLTYFIGVYPTHRTALACTTAAKLIDFQNEFRLSGKLLSHCGGGNGKR